MDEWIRLKEEADEAHVTVAALAYYKILNRQSIRIENPEFSKDIREMLSISRNINQIAATCNTLRGMPQKTLHDLQKALYLINKTLEKTNNDDF